MQHFTQKVAYEQCYSAKQSTNRKEVEMVKSHIITVAALATVFSLFQVGAINGNVSPQPSGGCDHSHHDCNHADVAAQEACLMCKGTGKSSSKAVKCTGCNGKGKVEVEETKQCPTCKGTGGLGGIVKCTKCKGKGKLTTKKKVNHHECNGTGKVTPTCTTCNGTGKNPYESFR